MWFHFGHLKVTHSVFVVRNRLIVLES